MDTIETLPGIENLPVEIGYEFIPANTPAEKHRPKGTRPVKIDVLMHTLLLGKSRTGKSSAAYRAIMGAIRASLGCAVFDPHGPLVAAVLSSLTPEELNRVVYVNPRSHKVPGIGYFDSGDPELSLEHYERHMEVRSGKNHGPRTAEWFNAMGRAALEFFKRPTILHIYKMLSRDRFAQSVLSRSKDPIVQDFYAFWWSKDIKPKDRMEAASHPRNKVVKLVQPGIREIVCQPGSLDWAKLMDDRAIVIFDIQTHAIGREKAETLGMLGLMNITDAAPHREHPERKFPIFVDESHHFLDAFDVETAVAESGKWGVVYWFIDQNLTQLRDEERRVYNDRILLGNCSNILACRVSGTDAHELAKEYGNPDMAGKLVELANYRQYAWTLKNNHPILKGQVCTYRIPKFPRWKHEKALAWAKENTGTDKAKVAAEIDEEMKREIPEADEKKREARKKRRRSVAGARSAR